MVCPNCGQEIREGTAFCINCGTPVTNTQNMNRQKMSDGDQAESVTGKLLRSANPMTGETTGYSGNQQPDGFLADANREDTADYERGMYADQPVKKKSKAWLVWLIVGIAVLLAIVLLLLLFVIFYPALMKYRQKAEATRYQIEHNDWNYNTVDDSNSSDEFDPYDPKNGVRDTSKTSDMATQAVSTVTTEEVTTTEAPKIYEHRYEIIVGDITWQEAKAACEARGGYLATITSQEEYDQICALANTYNIKYLWLGANISSVDDTWGQNGWLTGEAWTFERWYPGEPSKADLDGTEEFYLCMWKAKMENETEATTWTFNDQRNDIVSAVPSISGKLGYVLEYEVEVQP